MVEKTSFMGLGGPNLVKGATGQKVDAESLGGASMHTTTSGVAHYKAKNDEHCLELIRQKFREFRASPAPVKGTPSRKSADGLYGVLPSDHRLPYPIDEIVERLVDGEDFLEFQPEHAPEVLCANAKIHGFPIALIANQRGFLKQDGKPRIGGIIYTESARKVSYFVENAERAGIPILYLQDVSGFMVGPEAEASGIIRAGAEMVESMACATVPKILLVLNHASGAGYYAMGGQGFDPHFTFSWPTARIGVMEGDSAIQAVFGPELDKLKAAGKPVPADMQKRIDDTRADYERWLDSFHAASRGYCDAILDPIETRRTLSFLMEFLAYSGHREHLVLETLR